MKNHYETLGVSPESSPKEILKAYEKLKFMYSKDVMSADILFEGYETNLLKEVKEAYAVLSNPVKRSEYNLKHDIKLNRDLVRYNFDSPKYVNKSIIEIPDFAKTDDTVYTETLNNINKSRLQTKGIETPKYKINNDNEEKIKQETEYSGEFLKFVREYKNISYEFVASRLKFSPSYIKNIEEENFEALPAKVYIKGFLKSYAKLLDLPIIELSKNYMSRYDRSSSLQV